MIQIYRSNYENTNNWAYYVTREILNQTTRPDMANMTLTRFVTLLVGVDETRMIRREIFEHQDEILAEFRARDPVKSKDLACQLNLLKQSERESLFRCQVPAILVYRKNVVHKSVITPIDILKTQLQFNNFQVQDIYQIEPGKQESELKRSQAVFIVFDEEMNKIFDETLPYTPESDDLDFRHIGRILYHDFLMNDCRNERIYLFLTPTMNRVLHESFKYPWLLRENMLNFANDHELISRPHANRVRTYKKPAVLPDDVAYVHNLDHPERNNIDALLGSIYTNHNRSNRNFR